MAEVCEPSEIFQCPGEANPISRAVHLGRLARFYPACRTCLLHDDTGLLSAKHVARLLETRRRAPRGDLFDGEGLSGTAATEITPEVTRRFASALAQLLHTELAASIEPAPHDDDYENYDDDRTSPNTQAVVRPKVVLAGDGRPLTADLVAAAAEGLRFAGCDVVDLGGTTAPQLIHVQRALMADGGMLIGNAITLGTQTSGQHGVTLRGWRTGSLPCSAVAGLEEIATGCSDKGASQAARSAAAGLSAATFGNLRRYQSEAAYLAELEPYFHALRPLRIGFDSASLPLARQIERLSANVACQFVRPGGAVTSAASPLPSSDKSSLDLSIAVDGDGEACQVSDERGKPVPGHRLLAALATPLLCDSPGRAVIIEKDAPKETDRWITELGGRPVRCEPVRAEMYWAMHRHDALLGGGASGRFWFGGAQPAADALRTLAHLLVLLSQSDRPLSAVAGRSIFKA